jgi:hypothetical protein
MAARLHEAARGGATLVRFACNADLLRLCAVEWRLDCSKLAALRCLSGGGTMKKPHPHRFAIAFGLLAILFSSQALMGELTTRLVESPELPALYVTVDSVTVDEDAVSTIGLSVRNDSTNLAAIDGARSSLLIPDGRGYPLSAFSGGGFGGTLMPGNSASGMLRVSVRMQVGDQLELFLAWTLGAAAGSGAWTWKVTEAAAPDAELTAAPTPAPEPAATSEIQPPAPESTASDYIVGLAGLATGLVLLILLGWGLWSLVSLL